ncbi:MAG: hypothetical protein KAI17_03460, partial [Thiotrichaceae bacterium]|nr:hypothetical protein [Thiotrichaceae bacterium]
PTDGINLDQLESSIWPTMASGYVDPAASTVIDIATFPDFVLKWNGAATVQWFQIEILAFGDNKAYTYEAEKLGGTYAEENFTGIAGSTSDLWYLTTDRLAPVASQAFQATFGGRLEGSLQVSSNITAYIWALHFEVLARVDGSGNLQFMNFKYNVDNTNTILTA